MIYSNFISLWKKYIHNGLPQTYSDTEQRHTIFVNAFSIVGILSLSIFGISHIDTLKSMGTLELVFAALLISNIIIFHFQKKPRQAANRALGIMIFVLISLLYSGGIEGTGIYWYFTFPVLAFFLRGTKDGIMWVGALIGITIVASFAQASEIITLAYPLVVIRQMVASLIAVTLLVYFYQSIQENFEKKIINTTKELKELNSYLQEETRIASTNQDQVVKQNTTLQKTKKAMMNLLEDLEESKSNIEKINESLKVKDAELIDAQKIGQIGNYAWDIKTNKFDWSDMMFELHERTPEGGELTPETFTELIHPDDRKVTQENVERAIKTHAPYDNVYRINLKDGSIRWLRTQGKVVVDEHNNPIKLLGTTQNITKEREIDRAKTEFVSLASHQLRTPLSTINWYAEMLLAGDAGKLTPDQTQYIQEIYTGNQRMVELVNALLNVSRIDLGTFAVEPEPTDITKISESLLTELIPMIKTREVMVDKKYAENIPLISLDPKLIRIVLQNLLTNAIKYTPPKGNVTIDISNNKSSLQIKVADTGYGIPKAQQSKIFSKLFRADNVREKETDGTGLGLYIVKSIIEQSGGKISFKSEENKGTVFTVTLPLKGMKKKEGVKGLS
ncbi:MAG: ATP-binding protein [Patescibacteria group bacterium]